MEDISLFGKILYLGPPLLVAVILHEVAHGWVAEKLGDPTARRLGRITLNPIAHIDLWLTIIVPGLLIAAGSPFIFGGAKPVPVNPLNFRNPRRHMAYVAIAGPLTNFALVLICYGLFELLNMSMNARVLPLFVVTLLGFWLLHSIMVNLVLGLFNLLPVPPLDGGRIAVGFLPVSLARRFAALEPFGMLIVILLLASGAVRSILGPILEFFATRLFQHV